MARLILPAALVLILPGCVADPSAPLIPLPVRSATVLPSQAPVLDAQGFANTLADPATVAGLPRTPGEVEAAQTALAAEAAALDRRGTSLANRPSAAPALAARGRSHVNDTQSAIVAAARPSVPDSFGGAPVLRDGDVEAAATQPPALPPGDPVDPNAPVPRQVPISQ